MEGSTTRRRSSVERAGREREYPLKSRRQNLFKITNNNNNTKFVKRRVAVASEQQLQAKALNTY